MKTKYQLEKRNGMSVKAQSYAIRASTVRVRYNQSSNYFSFIFGVYTYRNCCIHTLRKVDHSTTK